MQSIFVTRAHALTVALQSMREQSHQTAGPRAPPGPVCWPESGASRTEGAVMYGIGSGPIIAQFLGLSPSPERTGSED